MFYRSTKHEVVLHAQYHVDRGRRGDIFNFHYMGRAFVRLRGRCEMGETYM